VTKIIQFSPAYNVHSSVAQAALIPLTRLAKSNAVTQSELDQGWPGSGAMGNYISKKS